MGFEPTNSFGRDLEYNRSEFKIECSHLRNDFKKWLSKYSKDYIKTILGYLDRYLTDRIIRKQKDILELINSVEVGKRQLRLRVFFNFLEKFDLIDKKILNKLRNVVKIPRTRSNNYRKRIKNEKTRIIGGVTVTFIFN